MANLSFPTVSVLFNQGGGSFEARIDYRTPAFASSVAIGDLDDDGKSDLVTSNLELGLHSGPEVGDVFQQRRGVPQQSWRLVEAPL